MAQARNALPLLIGLIGLIAVAATLWVLFLGGGTGSEVAPFLPDTFDQETDDTNPKVIDSEIAGQGEKDPNVASGTKQGGVEKVLPSLDVKSFYGSLAIKVAYRADQNPVPSEVLQWEVQYNELNAGRRPEPSADVPSISSREQPGDRHQGSAHPFGLRL